MVNHMNNRKQRRQDQYKYKKQIEVEETKPNPILIIIGMLVVFISFYFITDFIAPKPIALEPGPKSVFIQYEEILAGSIFNLNQSSYYVLFYEKDKFYQTELNNLISNYKSKNQLPLYLVDLSNGLNKNYLSEESNSDAQVASELKIKDLTLIKIRNKKNILYIESINKIKTELGVEI